MINGKKNPVFDLIISDGQYADFHLLDCDYILLSTGPTILTIQEYSF